MFSVPDERRADTASSHEFTVLPTFSPEGKFPLQRNAKLENSWVLEKDSVQVVGMCSVHFRTMLNSSQQGTLAVLRTGSMLSCTARNNQQLIRRGYSPLFIGNCICSKKEMSADQREPSRGQTRWLGRAKNQTKSKGRMRKWGLSTLERR